MDFVDIDFTKEQKMWREVVRKFTLKELMPTAKERAQRKEGFSRELIKKIAKIGALGLMVPTEYGGSQSDNVSFGIACEELSKSTISDGLLPTYAYFLVRALMQASEEVRQRWMPLIPTGDCICAPCNTEPHCGSDAASIRTTGIRDGEYYIINGQKSCISMGMIADVGVVFAKTDPSAGARGISAFLVPFDFPGVTRTPIDMTGWRPQTEASIFYDDVRIPRDYLLSQEGKGFYLVMSQFDVIRACVALTALGTAQASLEMAISYSKERTAFGRPIAKFEGISFKIAEDYTKIAAARMLCYHALRLADQGLPHTKASAMAKMYSPIVAVDAVHNAMLIHGNVGYSQELYLEQRLRDAIGAEFGDGTAEIMKLVIIRELLGREFLPY